MGLTDFELDNESGVPIWVQLRNRLMFLIDTGHFEEGEKLPTVRALAADLNINYHTVNKVYTSLEHEGYIESIRGKGAFVRKSATDSSIVSTQDVVISECIRQCLELGMSKVDVKKRFTHVLKSFED